VVKERAPFSIPARARSVRHALRGIAGMLVTEHNAWLHGAATLAVLVLGLALGLSPLEWALVTLAIVAVWVAEALNTALELLCNVASPDLHPLVERAKDVAAGGVLIAATGAAVIGLIVFLPKLAALLD